MCIDELAGTELISDIAGSCDQKYVVAKIDGPKGSRTVLASFDLPYHSDIVSELESSLEDGECLVDVLGGGIIAVDETAKIVRTFGKSGSFGKPRLPTLKSLLQGSFPSYRIFAAVTDYIRS